MILNLFYPTDNPTGDKILDASDEAEGVLSQDQDKISSSTIDTVDKLPEEVVEESDTALNQNDEKVDAEEYDGQFLYLSPTAYETVIGLDENEEDERGGDDGAEGDDCTCYIRVDERPKQEHRHTRTSRTKTREKTQSKESKMKPTTKKSSSTTRPDSSPPSSTTSPTSSKGSTLPISNVKVPRESKITKQRKSKDGNGRRRSVDSKGRKSPTGLTSSKEKRTTRIKSTKIVEARDPSPQERNSSLRTKLMKPVATNLNRNGRSKQELRQQHQKQPVRQSSRHQSRTSTPRKSRGRSPPPRRHQTSNAGDESPTKRQVSRAHDKIQKRQSNSKTIKRKESPAKRHQQRKLKGGATKTKRLPPTKSSKDITMTKKAMTTKKVKSKPMASSSKKNRVTSTGDQPIVHSRQVIALPRYYVDTGDHSHASDSTPMDEVERKFMRDKFSIENE